jgi:glycosyltransferase involved in cell wall biosynthesis
MKIAYVYDVVYPYVKGGAQKRIWEISIRLAQRGHQVTIFGMKYWEGDDVIYKERVRLWGVCPSQELFVHGRRSVWEAVYFAWRVLPPLMKERFDIVDTGNFPYFPCFSAKFYAVTTGSRLVITWHEVWGDYWLDYLGRKGVFGKAIERLVAYMPHKAITVSTSTKTALEKLGHKQVVVIPDGVDLQLIESVSPSTENSDIIFVGRLIKEKNVALLIRAVGLLAEKGAKVKCLIIGDGPEREPLQRLAQGLGLEGSIHFKGHIEDDVDVISLMKSSRVFVLPSLREGFGRVALEANGCGLPLITVRHPQNATCDLIEEGKNGLTCEISERDMVEKILAVLSSGNPWKENCQQFARKYDWDAIVNLIEEAYKGS